MVDPKNFVDGLDVRAGGVSSDYMDYWRQYRGRRVDVREGEFRRAVGDGGYVRDVFLVRGEVAGVLDSPEGLLLRDVEEIHRHLEYGLEGEEGVECVDRIVRSVEEKVVSFSEMEEVELTSEAERAVEGPVD